MRICLLSFCLAACLAAPARAGTDDPAADDDIPLVGRPADHPFSGASGNFKIETRAEPVRLRLDDRITFTIIVHAMAPVRHWPRRPDLRQLHAFDDSFYVEDGDEHEHRPDDKTLEFGYFLKPRTANVNRVPGLPFVFYNPALGSGSKAFQTIVTDDIPLKILNSDEYAALPAGPESLYALAGRQNLFAHDRSLIPPGPGTVVLLVVIPPLICAGWYVGWLFVFPGAARQARRRRSLAARRSLNLLRSARRLPHAERAGCVADALAGYLRERFQLIAAEPTPAEAAAAMRRAGLEPKLVDAASRCFAACDAARYSPSRNGEALAAEATRLVLDLEAHTWAPSS